ncbi:3803_t:CDS:2, partial [Paraglomus brasilianum]
GGHVSTFEECTKYIQQPTFTNNFYFGYFRPPLYLQMVPSSSTEGLTGIGFIMTVTDTRFSPSVTDIAQMEIMLVDTGSSGPSAHNTALLKPNVYGSIGIRPNSFFVKTEIELRSRTVMFDTYI